MADLPFAVLEDGTLAFGFNDTGHAIDIGPPEHGRRLVTLRVPGQAPIAARITLSDLEERRRLTDGLNGRSDQALGELALVAMAVAKLDAAGIAVPASSAPGPAAGPTHHPTSTTGAARRTITAADLSRKAFPDPRYAVPGVVPEGANLLVGAPKKGKSWFLLGLGIAIAAGGRALGKIPVEQGDVLLLCLEDNQRRLQERLIRVLDGAPAPERLHMITEWPRLDEGADRELDAWLRDHPEARLVGIDVIARLRPPSSAPGNPYQLDYWTLARLKAVADAHGVALVAVHHSRKASADDPLDTISGTAGLAGAADTALILTREKGRAEANLYVRGRDVPEADYALSFDPVTCTWNLLGDAAEFRLTAGRAEVQKLLRARGPLTPKAIAEALGAEPGNVRVLLHRMRNAEQVVARDGLYALPPCNTCNAVTLGQESASPSQVSGEPGVTPTVTPGWGCNGDFPATTPNVTPLHPLHRPTDREVIEL